MKFSKILILCFLIIQTIAPLAIAATPGSLELDLSSSDYRKALEGRQVLFSNSGLERILKIGQRNLDWLELINKNRPDDKKLELSTAATQGGIPIESPRKSNPTIIQADFDAITATLPKSVSDVLLNNWPQSEQPPIEDEAFLEIARKIDRSYQSASRWILQEPDLWSYTMRSNMDIRGYVFLSREAGLEAKLKGWTGLDAEVRKNFENWLVGECHNSNHSIQDCKNILSHEISVKGHPWNFHLTYLAGSKELYDGFFELQNSRSDSHWNAGKSLYTVPFKTPELPAVGLWLSTNIEDEWRFNGFQLRLNFKSNGSGMPRVVFEAGATPHVDGLGGNTITMDANRSIQEYSSRWTIRHEFGHVLGFPDCYVEYYDNEDSVMISYQIDIENLMCSRKGKFKQTHLDELRKAN